MNRDIGRSLGHRCSGFTLIEVLIALVILTIAVLGVGAAVGVQSGGTAKGVSYGLGAVSRAGLISTATFLAQDQLEQVKRLRYIIGPPVVDDFGTNAWPTGFSDGPISGYPNFSRQVRFWTGPPQAPDANIRLITVTVTFSAPGDEGVNTESVAVSTLMAARP